MKNYIVLLYLIFLSFSLQAERLSKASDTDPLQLGKEGEVSLKDLLRITNKNSKMAWFSDENPCLTELVKLVKSSNFNTPLAPKNQLIIWIDEKFDKMIRIQVTWTNEGGLEVTVGWLLFDLEKQELLDITKDPDNPIKLTIDKNLVPAIQQKCF